MVIVAIFKCDIFDGIILLPYLSFFNFNISIISDGITNDSIMEDKDVYGLFLFIEGHFHFEQYK